MFGWGAFAASRLWPGTDWVTFISFFVLVICLMAWHFNRVYTHVPNHVLPEAAMAAPVDEIDDYIRRYEDDGYMVSHARDLDPVRNDHDRLIIEYIVMTPERDQFWEFKWAWEVPVQLTDDWLIFATLEEKDIPGLA